MTFPSRQLAWLREQYQLEYVSDLGPPNVMHRAERGHAGAFVNRVRRILDGDHLRWQETQFTGKRTRYVEAWVQPFHEAVKRLEPRPTDESRLTRFARSERRSWKRRWGWLRSYLVWRGQPCVCNHRDVVDHLASVEGQTRSQMQGALEAACREALRSAGDHVGYVPPEPKEVRLWAAISRQPALRAARAASQGRTKSLIPSRPRTALT